MNKQLLYISHVNWGKFKQYELYNQKFDNCYEICF